MERLEQNVLLSLLDVLKRSHLVNESVFSGARREILDTLDWPEFFCYADCDKIERKENENGSSENPRGNADGQVDF